MSEIIWLDENETEPRKQNFAIRQLLERVPGAEDGIDALETAVTGLDTRIDTLEALPACFFAHKNSADQTGIADSTATLLTFGTEVFDVGARFASNAWTPPAGKVFLSARVYATGTITAGATASLLIYKDGSKIAQSNHAAGTNMTGSTVSTIDTATGSSVYTAYVYVDTSAGDATASGDFAVTTFCGFWISA